METIKVIWKSYHRPDAIERGYWDQAILEEMFQHVGPYAWQHCTSFSEITPGEGAVVVLNGRMHFEDIKQINKDIAGLVWCLFIITGDEEALFPWREIRHPMLRTWAQLPRMNVHNDVSQKLPNGPRPGTRETLAEIGPLERNIDFMFVGQINHARREQCLEAAQSIKDEYATILTGTDGFGKEVFSHYEYLQIMAHSKVVLCPSGIETPDSFRLYEALETGCMPIVDAFATRNQSPGFWSYLFDENVPFPIVDYWDKLPALLPEVLREWPHNANRAAAWWQNKKRLLRLKMLDDIKEIKR